MDGSSSLFSFFLVLVIVMKSNLLLFFSGLLVFGMMICGLCRIVISVVFCGS